MFTSRQPVRIKSFFIISWMSAYSWIPHLSRGLVVFLAHTGGCYAAWQVPYPEYWSRAPSISSLAAAQSQHYQAFCIQWCQGSSSLAASSSAPDSGCDPGWTPDRRDTAAPSNKASCGRTSQSLRKQQAMHQVPNHLTPRFCVLAEVSVDMTARSGPRLFQNWRRVKTC